MKATKEQNKTVDKHPAVVALLEKKKEIALQIGQLDAAILTAQNAGDDVQRQAAAFLGNGQIGDAQRELDLLHHRQRVLKSAMNQLDNQLFNQRKTAAAELSVVYAPEYKALSAQTLEAMKLLKDSLLKERRFFESMRQAGLVDHFKERLDIPKLIGGIGFEDHVDHSLLHRHIMHRQG